ncbi:hypothetical protein ATCC90586_008897 [Pythium insidiosum]|nr:hypothetical protein ATCC90586_008897 [Pythium insidiosum]
MAKAERAGILTIDQLRHADDWVRDFERSHCVVCMRAFQLLRRKHHCRQCGEIICSSCLSLRPANLPVIGLSKVKVCVPCVLRATMPAQPRSSKRSAQLPADTHKPSEPRPMSRSDAHVGQSSPVPAFAPSSLPATGHVEAASRQECAICMSRERDAVCVPCGHMAGCQSCLARLARDAAACPICRSAIERVIRVYEC